jgi:hypothetical protein
MCITSRSGLGDGRADLAAAAPVVARRGEYAAIVNDAMPNSL